MNVFMERNASGGMALVPSPRQSTFFYAIALLLAAYGTREPAWWVSGGILFLMGIFWQPLQNGIKMVKKRYQASFENSLRVGVGIAAFTTIQAYSQKPAYAFLGRACAVLKKITEATNTGGEGGNSVQGLIEATIYIVRGLFLVYLGIAVVNVIRQARQDEDWKTAAQTPMLAVVLIAAVEGISAIVAPDAGTGC